MSLKDLSSVSASVGQPSRINLMEKPSPQSLQNQAVGSTREQSEPGYSTLSYILSRTASLFLVCGLIYIGYELTKPTKKIPLNKPTKKMDEEKDKAKQESKVPDTVKTPTPAGNDRNDRHVVEIERKSNEDIGFSLCRGEENQPGVFVQANSANTDLGLKIGAQLLEINGKVLDSEMSCKDIVELLAKSCSPKGKLCFKTNEALCKKWKEAEATKQEGNKLFKDKKIDEAITKYTAAIQLHPTNWVYYSNKAQALYSKAKANLEIAEEIYTEALSLCNTAQELDIQQNLKKLYHLRGVILFELQSYEEAKNAFERYLQIDSTNETIRARLVECEKAIAAAVAAKVAKEKEESNDKTSVIQKDEVLATDVKTDSNAADVKTDSNAVKSQAKQVQNESPSPVLVEKPSPTEVTEVEPLVGNGQQQADIGKESPEKVIDDSSVTVSGLIEETKEETAKSLDEAKTETTVVQKD